MRFLTKTFEVNPRGCDGIITALRFVFDANLQSTKFMDEPVINRMLSGFGNYARQSIEPRWIKTFENGRHR